MIEGLIQLRNQLDQAIAVIGPLVPVLAAWQAVQAPGEAATPTQADLLPDPQTHSDAALGVALTAQGAPQAPTQASMAPDQPAPAGGPATPKGDGSRSKPGPVARRMPEEKRAYHAEWARQHRAKVKAAANGQSRESAAACDTTSSVADLAPLPDIERPMRAQFVNKGERDDPDPRREILAEATALPWLDVQ